MALKINMLKNRKQQTSRFIELDIFRGVAIISMIFLHLLWDLDYFGFVPLNETIYQFNKIIPTMFFLLVGICLAISVAKNHKSSERTLVNHLLVRGLWILGLGIIITIVTLIVMPDRPIFFGVLHCIGLSIILSIPFLRFKAYNALIAPLILLLGIIVGLYHIDNPTIVHLVVGLHPAEISHYTIDYFPLLPWFGVSLFGIALGNWLYKDGKRQFSFPDLSQYKPVSLVSWFGKHSLLIYLLHQPVIAGILGLYLIL